MRLGREEELRIMRGVGYSVESRCGAVSGVFSQDFSGRARLCNLVA